MLQVFNKCITICEQSDETGRNTCTSRYIHTVMSIQRPRQTELVICMMGGCGELRHCSRTAIWLVSFHGGRWTFRVQEVPDKNGIVMRAAHYLEVIKLKSEHSTSVLLLWGVCVCEMCVCGGGVRCEWREWGVKVSRRYTHTHTCSLQTDTMITSPRVFWDRWRLQECVGPVQPGSPTPWWHWRGSKIMSCSNENNYLNFPQSHWLVKLKQTKNNINCPLDT